MSDVSHLDDDEFDTEAAPLGEDEYEDDPNGLSPPEAELTDEDRAHAQGWRRDKRGPNGVSLTAAEYLARGEQEMPVLRNNVRRLTDELARLTPRLETAERTIVQQAQAIKDGVALAQRATDQGYQRAIADLKAQRDAAAETGAMDVYRQVDQQIDAMQSERASAVAPPPTPPAPPNTPAVTDPVIRDFLATPPPWFQNPEMRAALIAAQSELVKANPGVAEGDLLDDAIDEVAAIFPGRIRNRGAPPVTPRDRQPQDPPPRERAPARRPAGVLPSGGAGGGARPAAARDPFSRLPEADRAEARAAFQRQAPWGEPDAANYVKLRLGERSAADIAAETRAARQATRRGG